MRGILDLSDLPEYEGMEDEGFPPLPPPGSPGQGGQDDGEPFANDGGEEAELSKLDDVPAAKRKGVKRPQPKLDSQRLISDRGLPALRSLFQDLQFKGKGHEAENLQLLMQKMENWAHRLYPKLQFEDFIEKVEKLGSKKEVQTCLKRIRLDMPLTHEDFTGEEAGLPDLQLSEDLDPFSRLVHSTPAPTEARLAEAPPPPAPPTPPSLTEEQRSRMELNRRRALERRLARQQLPDSQTVDSSQLQPTSPTAGVLQSTREGEEGMMEVGQEEKMEEIEEERNVEEKVEMVLEETTEEEEKEKNVEKEIDEEKVEKEDMDEEKVEMLQEEEEEERNAEEENADFAPPPEEQTVGASPPQQQRGGR